MDLAEFLLARIAEDEEVAYHAQGVLGMVMHWHEVETLRDRGLTIADARHVNRWSSARVLAKCKADRRIVELFDEADPGEWGDGALRFLALPHADHPDYQQDWKP